MNIKDITKMTREEFIKEVCSKGCKDLGNFDGPCVRYPVGESECNKCVKEHIKNIKFKGEREMEKEEFTFEEVFSRIKPGETYVRANESQNLYEIKKIGNETKISFKQNTDYYVIADNLKFKFKKEYMTFDEAIKSGKKLRYRTWKQGYYDLYHAIYHLGKEYTPDEIESMANSKTWEIEQ